MQRMIKEHVGLRIREWRVEDMMVVMVEAYIFQKMHNLVGLVIADVFIGKCKDEHTVHTYPNFSSYTRWVMIQSEDIGRKGLWSTVCVVYNWDQVWVHVVVPFAEIRDLTVKR
eukprot:899799_1